MDATLVYDEQMPRFAKKYRVEAIADGLMRRGFEVDFVPSSDLLLKAGVIVCDSHRTHAGDQSRYKAERTVGLDDLARDLPVDMLVDPSVGATSEIHRRARCVMAGSRFIPVNPQVIDYQVQPPQKEIEKVLVAVDADNEKDKQIGSYIAAQLADSLIDGVRVNLLEDTDWKPNGSLISKIDYDIATEEMASADLVVSSGGSLLHEALALGRPTVTFALNPIERRNVAGSNVRHAAIASTPETAANMAVSLAHNLAERRELFKNSRLLIDGLGAARIAEEIARQVSLIA